MPNYLRLSGGHFTGHQMTDYNPSAAGAIFRNDDKSDRG
jgi:hypothetical protein